MPHIRNEFDVVQGFLQQAAQVIRDAPCGTVELERNKNAVYHHIYEALNLCVTFAHGEAPCAEASPELLGDLDLIGGSK